MKKSIRYAKGASLIVVLVLIVIIMIVGLIAIKVGLSSLKISTNAQAQSLLIQSSDSVFFRTEDAQQLANNLRLQGMFGYIKQDANKGRELVFCFRPKKNTSFFNIGQASLISWDSGLAPNFYELGINGYCDVTKDFNSGRDAVVTQVTVSQKQSTQIPFSHMQEGTDNDSAKVEDAAKIVIHATSVIPALTSADKSTAINTCFSTRMSDPVVPASVEATLPTNSPYRQSVTECLNQIGVPFSTQVNEYSLLQYITKSAAS